MDVLGKQSPFEVMLYPSCWMADYPAKKVFHLQLEFLLGPAISEVTESVPGNLNRKRRHPTTCNRM